MGAAKIIEHLGDGLYQIQRIIVETDGELAFLASKRAFLEGILPKWRNAIAQQWDEVQVLRQTVNTLIEDWARGGFVEYASVPADKSTPTEADKTEVFNLVNQIRENNGLPPFEPDTALSSSAQDQADWMGANTVGHEGENGSRPQGRISAAGFTGSPVAENVAAGQSTPEQVVASWMNSPGHRANILNPDLKKMGIGGGTGSDYGRTWAQTFGGD